MQVESAKLKYMLPRLVGMHEALTRQGGTSGSMSSRGAGEKKLELDRRRIEKRIAELGRDLKDVARERQVQRKQRQKARIPLAALTGYTNAGKSTILNALIEAYGQEEDKKVFAQDMLFATLDTAVRRIRMGNGQDFLLSDTVGFIHKLPHGLVRAFHATLEELESADLLLHVVDASDTGRREQMETTKELLSGLQVSGIPVITVYNKADCCEGMAYPKIQGEDRIYISAKDESSIQALVQMITAKLYENYILAEFQIPYDKGEILSYFMENAHVLDKRFEETGTWIQARCHKADLDKYRQYVM